MSISWCQTEGTEATMPCFVAGHNVIAKAVTPGHGQAWCWTEDQLATFRCRERQHDVREHRGFASPDPAVKQWGQAMAQSTGARLREALEANDALAKEHGLCVIEVERLRAERDKAVRERDSLARRLALRFEETRRLRAQLDSLPGYHLTDKGQAAIAQPETE